MSDHASWEDLLRDHQTAIEEFATRAEAVPEEIWLTPRAAGKWSPAQQAEHLAHVYGGLCRCLAEGLEVPILLPRWKSLLARWIHLRRILKGYFPKGAKAPRPTRPRNETTDRETLLDQVRSRSAQFENAIDEARSENPQGTMNHPYFGSLPYTKYLKLNAEHVRHHGRQLPD